MPSRLTTARLAQHIVDGVPEIEDPRGTLEALLSLVGLLADDDELAAEELAEDVARSPDLGLDEDRREQFAEHLRELLRLEPVVLAARAHDVATDSERVFHEARVLTDLRPIFGQDASAGAKAATILATLRIKAHEDTGGLKSYYFALDHADLLDLQAVIRRALAKMAAMKRVAERMQLPYWEYEEVDDDATGF